MDARHFTVRLTAPIYSTVQLERKNKFIWHLRPPPLWIMYHPSLKPQPPHPNHHHYSTLFLWFPVLSNANVQLKHITFIQKESLVFDLNLLTSTLPSILNNNYTCIKLAFMHLPHIKYSEKCPSVIVKLHIVLLKKPQLIYKCFKIKWIIFNSVFYRFMCLLASLFVHFTPFSLWTGRRNNRSLTIITCAPRSQ